VKPAPFQYEAPSTLDGATALLHAHRDDVKVLAGGQSLLPLLALRLTRFDLLVDLSRIESLNFVRDDGDQVAVGAMTTQAEALRSPVVRDRVPLLARALPLIGHFQIRNRGTIGGSLAHADPAAELPATALVLDAEFVVASPDRQRTVAAPEFFRDVWTTAVGPEEILTEVRFPCSKGKWGWALHEFSRRSGDFAIAGAAVGIRAGEGGLVEECRIAMFGVGPTPIRGGRAEMEVVGVRPDAVSWASMGRLAAESADPSDDVHGSSAYRREVAAVMVERALTAAAGDLARA
jgi:carbon-monoxide dehydrogenase medium subunit